MTTIMTRTARERFLSGLHVGVMSVAVPGHGGGTLAVPIWYDYAPDRGVWVITSRESAKGKALEAAGRFGLAVQHEQIPYEYVSVEGPITDVHIADLDGDLLPMAVRYLGDELGGRYAEQWAATNTGVDHVYTIHPERWASADMASTFAALRGPGPAASTAV